MGSIFELISALRKGSSLANVEAWKRGGTATAILLAIFSALSGIAVSFGWLPEGVDHVTLMELSAGIVAVVGLVLGYLGVATTTKIGLK